MSRRANPVAIGAFVVGAVILLVVGVMAFGSGVLFRNTTTYVMYFGGDVNGLRVGAPVTFRGVPVGEVTAIRASLQRRIDRIETRIAVYAELGEGPIDLGEGMSSAHEDEESYRLLIENGLRAQLQMESLVTGLLLVQLDFHPDRPAIFVGGDPDTREIPTIPTPLEIVTSSVRRLLERLGELPLEDIVRNLNTSLEGAGKLLNSEETHNAVSNLERASRDLNVLIGRANVRVDELADRLEETLVAARKALDRAQGSLGALSEDSALRQDVATLIDEATEAARALRVLAETIERNPESLLSGKAEP
jgi:paraquat-inducible protein B